MSLGIGANLPGIVCICLFIIFSLFQLQPMEGEGEEQEHLIFYYFLKPLQENLC